MMGPMGRTFAAASRSCGLYWLGTPAQGTLTRMLPCAAEFLAAAPRGVGLGVAAAAAAGAELGPQPEAGQLQDRAFTSRSLHDFAAAAEGGRLTRGAAGAGLPSLEQQIAAVNRQIRGAEKQIKTAADAADGATSQAERDRFSKREAELRKKEEQLRAEKKLLLLRLPPLPPPATTAAQGGAGPAHAAVEALAPKESATAAAPPPALSLSDFLGRYPATAGRLPRIDPQATLLADKSADALRLPYQPIETVQKHVAEVLRANLRVPGSTARDDHRVGLVVGAPGSGKTECLRQLKPMLERACPDELKAFDRIDTLLLTYNFLHGPTVNEISSGKAFKRAFALRLVHELRCDPFVPFETFESDAMTACPAAVDKLTPVAAIRLLREWLGLREGERWLLLLGVDEFNKLMMPQRGAPALQALTFLASELGLLASAGPGLPATTVVPYAAGTAAEPGVLAFVGSGSKHEAVNFMPLSIADRGRIMDALAEGDAPYLKGWRGCSPLGVAIAYMGGHPRIFVNLVRVLQAAGASQPGLALRDWDWSTILNDMEKGLKNWSLLTLAAGGIGGGRLREPVLSQLLQDALLQTSVSRDSRVSYAPDKQSRSLSYGDLETVAGVILQAVPEDDWVRVYMPPVVMRQIVRRLISLKRDRWCIGLRDLLTDYTNTKVVATWQNWEKFIASAEAAKLALAWRLEKRLFGECAVGVQLGEFLGIQPDTIADGPPQLRWRIRPLQVDGDVGVIHVAEQFPTRTQLTEKGTGAPVDWAAGNMILNGAGARLGDCVILVHATLPDGSEKQLLLSFEGRYRKDAPTLESLGWLHRLGDDGAWGLPNGGPAVLEDGEGNKKSGDLVRKYHQIARLAKSAVASGHAEFQNGGWLLVVLSPLTPCELALAQVAQLGPCVVLDAAGVRAQLGPAMTEAGSALLGDYGNETS